MSRSLASVAFVSAVSLWACSDSGQGAATGQGGALQSGGSSGTGGTRPASGGSPGSGGQVATGGASGGVVGSGGSTTTGGQIAAGGQISSGGASAAGGVLATGGTTGGGGAVATGGRGTGGSTTTDGAAGGSSATGGARASGGASATGGARATGGANGTGGSTAPTCRAIASTATRPQLSSAEAANYTTAKYLGDFSPGAGVDLPDSPTYTVAADGSGDATTVKGALAKATGASRVNILIKPGTYREKINLSGSTPITLYGADPDARKVVIVYGDSNDSAGGTSKSASFTVSNPAFQAKNLTFANDLNESASGCGNCQAVAFYSTGDKLVFDNVRFTGNQDTAYFDSSGSSTIARVYLRGCYVEGDTDYIFGRATVVIEDSEIRYTSLRNPGNAGRQIAPSTAAANKYGYLFNRCKFTADSATPSNKIYLGRSWDQNVSSAGEWNASTSPNGQAVIRESELGAHIRLVDPWAPAATSGRTYNASTNRFYEYCNTGPGAG